MEDGLKDIPEQLQQLMDAISDLHPDSRFGVGEFKDKPHHPFGHSDDYCYRLAVNLESSQSGLIHAYSNLRASGGMDGPDSQFQALINAIQDPNVKWGNPEFAESANMGARVIVLNTDSIPHFEGDYSSSLFDPTWAPYPGHMTDDLTYDCEQTRYPSGGQVAAAFKESEKTYLIILTPHHNRDVIEAWKWVNEELNQDRGFYQFIGDGRELYNGVLDALDFVSRTACGYGATAASTNVTAVPQ